MTHDEVRDALPLFVVDADDQATRRELLDHLADVRRSAGAPLQEYQQAADALAQSVPADPPAPRAARPDAGGDRRVSADARGGRQGSPDAVCGASARNARAGWAPWLAAAAALVAAVATAACSRPAPSCPRCARTLAVVAGAGGSTPSGTPRRHRRRSSPIAGSSTS